ncbi:MAG: AAA family ATPase [Thermoleophilia bacterium]
MSVSRPPDRQGAAGDEERVDVRRYIAAIRRSALLIAVIVIVVTGAVHAISLMVTPTYQAQAKLVLEETTSVLGQGDAVSAERRLATMRQLLTASRILDAAGRRLGVPGSSLAASVKPSIDNSANIIYVTAEHEKPARAAAIANAVTQAFLADRVEVSRRQLVAARQAVQERINELSARRSGGPELEALRQRLADLGVAAAAVGSDLQVAERAQTPSSPVSPRPLRNAVLALFAALFLGILVALARDQLGPRIGSSRELSRILDLPVLAGIPDVPRRWRTRRARILSGVEDEAYQTLRATLEFAAWEHAGRVVLVTSAVSGEGKTTASARLGRALARAGFRTLVISADLRRPTLHEEFGLARGTGLAEILPQLESTNRPGASETLLRRATNVVVAGNSEDAAAGCLHVITSGTETKGSIQLVSGQPMRTFLGDIKRQDYDYVLIDAPPLLGLVDSQVLAQWSDSLLVVARVDSMTLNQATELRIVLQRLETSALGIVAIGVEGESSPYYLAKRPEKISSELE